MIDMKRNGLIWIGVGVLGVCFVSFLVGRLFFPSCPEVDQEEMELLKLTISRYEERFSDMQKKDSVLAETIKIEDSTLKRTDEKIKRYRKRGIDVGLYDSLIRSNAHRSRKRYADIK